MKTYSEHTFLQTISVLSHAESKNKLSFLMCPYKIKLFLPILKIPLVSLVSHQISAFLILPFIFPPLPIFSHTPSPVFKAECFSTRPHFLQPLWLFSPIICFPLSLFTFLSVSLSPLIRLYVSFAASIVV